MTATNDVSVQAASPAHEGIPQAPRMGAPQMDKLRYCAGIRRIA